jgi:rhamnose transport system substrate-binding protein
MTRIAQEVILIVLVAVEIALFGLFGKNFLTAANGFEIVRLSVEVGLLALALTPVIVSGGIDLSVGSLMGLSAVIFGMLWRDAHVPIWLAVPCVLAFGIGAGRLNGLFITWLRLPPLIVTLGTFSLFRGLAEGMTRGVENYTSFPPGFLYLGQGYMVAGVPTQLPLFVLAAAGFWWLLHQTATGRSLVAIGLSPEGARYAGIRVERKLILVYVLSGAVASLAAIIYVSHLGQAKADAGTGYELMAITAVVLGGTSIFGGRGTVHGTLLGLIAIVILQNGLRLAALPSELAGILIGGVLLLTITVERIAAFCGAGVPACTMQPRRLHHNVHEEFEVKNSQVAVICGVILLGFILVTWSNVQVGREIARQMGGDAARAARLQAMPHVKDDSTDDTTRSLQNRAPLTIAMMPKSKGNAYFIACRRGAEEAAKELGINLIWDGPTDTDPAKQNEVVEAWITRGAD